MEHAQRAMRSSRVRFLARAYYPFLFLDDRFNRLPRLKFAAVIDRRDSECTRLNLAI